MSCVHQVVASRRLYGVDGPARTLPQAYLVTVTGFHNPRRIFFHTTPPCPFAPALTCLAPSPADVQQRRENKEQVTQTCLSPRSSRPRIFSATSTMPSLPLTHVNVDRDGSGPGSSGVATYPHPAPILQRCQCLRGLRKPRLSPREAVSTAAPEGLQPTALRMARTRRTEPESYAPFSISVTGDTGDTDRC